MGRKKKVESEVLVKIGRSGGRVEEYALEGDEPTVLDAMEAAGITLSKGDKLRINGEAEDEEGDTITEDTIVVDGDIITIAGKVSGGVK